jgi:glycosyltransferase 2 family protein
MDSPLDAAEHARAHRRRVLIGTAKLLLAVGIIAWMFIKLRNENAFHRLVHDPKHWGYLAAAQVLVLVAISLNYIRWYLLVRALGLDFRLRDAFRLGSIGMLINQALPAGSVGGDLFKAVFIAREQPDRRTEAVASIVIDRVVGLYAMTLVASAGYLLGSRATTLSASVETLGRFVVGVAITGTIGIALLMTPFFTSPRVEEAFGKLPLVGSIARRLVVAAAAYRSERRYLFAGIVLSCCTHTIFVTSFWCIAQGLPVTAPSLANTFIIGPMSLAAGALPLTPGGLGVFEAALDKLFTEVGARAGDGFLVGLTYRVMTYVMAAVGAIYYVAARKTVIEVMHEADELADEGIG